MGPLPKSCGPSTISKVPLVRTKKSQKFHGYFLIKSQKNHEYFLIKSKVPWALSNHYKKASKIMSPQLYIFVYQQWSSNNTEAGVWDLVKVGNYERSHMVLKSSWAWVFYWAWETFGNFKPTMNKKRGSNLVEESLLHRQPMGKIPIHIPLNCYRPHGSRCMGLFCWQRGEVA